MYFILFFHLQSSANYVVAKNTSPCIKWKELLSDSLLNKTQILKVKIAILGDWFMAQFNSVCDPGHYKFIFQIMSLASSSITEKGEENV